MSSRIEAAVMGAVAGAALGSPFRGATAFRVLNYYEPIPTRMTASECLDWWLCAARIVGSGLGPESISTTMRQSWRSTTHETAFGRVNLDHGFTSPIAGSLRNPLADGSQALGRCAIWGVLFPGDSTAAVKHAMLDASADHAAEGVWCACACAAMTASAAAGESVEAVLRAGLNGAPPDSRLRTVVSLALDHRDHGKSPADYFATLPSKLPTRDSFAALLNFGWIVAALTFGDSDFGRSVCIAAGCGGASDQTCVTVGTIVAAMNGEVSPDWLQPLGSGEIAPYVAGHWLNHIDPPRTLVGYVEAIASAARPLSRAGMVEEAIVAEPEVDEAEMDLAEQQAQMSDDGAPTYPPEELDDSYRESVPMPEEALATETRTSGRCEPTASSSMACSIPPPPYSTTYFMAGTRVIVEFVDQPILQAGQSLRLILRFCNPGSSELTLMASMRAPDGWIVATKMSGFRLRPGDASAFALVLQAPSGREIDPITRLTLSLNTEDVEIPVLRAQPWFVVGPFANAEGEGFNKSYRCEDVLRAGEVFNGRSNLPVRWTVGRYPGIRFDLEAIFSSGAGVAYLYGRLRFAYDGPKRVVCACSTGAICWINRQKLIWYHDRHVPIPRAIQPYVASFESTPETHVMVKVIRNLDPIEPLVLYFLNEDGSLAEPVEFLLMDG